MARVAFVGPYLHSDDLSVVDDQRFSPGVGHHASGARCDGGAKALHEEPTGGVDPPGFVPARHRDGNFVERIAVLTAAEEQPRVIG